MIFIIILLVGFLLKTTYTSPYSPSVVQSVCSKKCPKAHKCVHGMLKSERHILWWYTCKNMKYSYFLWELFPSEFFQHIYREVAMPAFCQWLVFSVRGLVASFSPLLEPPACSACEYLQIKCAKVICGDIWLLPWHTHKKQHKRSV